MSLVRHRRDLRRWAAGRRTGRQVRRWLAAHDLRLLQLGAGHNRLDGWLNTDRDPDAGVVILDVTRRFPMPSNSVHAVFNEHVLEHVSYAQARHVLRECRRVLRPGGVLRTATPDLDRLLDLREAGAPIARRYAAWLREDGYPEAAGSDHVFALNRALRAWGHQFVYDEATLAATLVAADFEDVRRCEWGESPHAHLRGLEDHGADQGSHFARFETMILEAAVPRSSGRPDSSGPADGA